MFFMEGMVTKSSLRDPTWPHALGSLVRVRPGTELFKELRPHRGWTWIGALGSWASPGCLLLASLFLFKETTFKRGVVEAVRHCTLVPVNLRGTAAFSPRLSLNPPRTTGRSEGVGAPAVGWQCRSALLRESQTLTAPPLQKPGTAVFLQKVPGLLCQTPPHTGPPFFAKSYSPPLSSILVCVGFFLRSYHLPRISPINLYFFPSFKGLLKTTSSRKSFLTN